MTVGVLILSAAVHGTGRNWPRSIVKREDREEWKGTLGTRWRVVKREHLHTALWAAVRVRTRVPFVSRSRRKGRRAGTPDTRRVANAKRPLPQGRLRARSPFGMRAYREECQPRNATFRRSANRHCLQLIFYPTPRLFCICFMVVVLGRKKQRHVYRVLNRYLNISVEFLLCPICK